MMYFKRKTVFISYAHEDKTKAEFFYEFLQINGHKPWMDDEDMRSLDLWEREARKAIKRNDIFMLLLSEQSVKKDRFVRTEINIAVEEHKKRGKPIVPIMLDGKYEIPIELKKFDAERDDPDGREQLLYKLNTFNKGFKFIIALFVLGFLAFLVSFLNFRETPHISKTVFFSATILDAKTAQPLEGAVAFVLQGNKDTLICSKPSNRSGIVEFQLDTLDHTKMDIVFYHPDYRKETKSYVLMVKFAKRMIRLRALESHAPSPPALAKQKLLFSLSGIELDQNEKEEIYRATGYIYSNDASLKLTIDYDHAAYSEMPNEELCCFLGSAVFISRSDSEWRLNTGLKLPKGLLLSQEKSEQEIENKGLLDQTILTYKERMISKIIECLSQK